MASGGCVSAFLNTFVVTVVGAQRVGKTAFARAYARAHGKRAGVYDEYAPTTAVDPEFMVVQMEDFVLNRVVLYDTPGEQRWRSLGISLVDGGVATAHVVVVMYDVEDVAPFPTIQEAVWWLKIIRGVPHAKDVDVVLVGCRCPKPREDDEVDHTRPSTAATYSRHSHSSTCADNDDTDSWGRVRRGSEVMPPPGDLDTAVEAMVAKFNITHHHHFDVGTDVDLEASMAMAPGTGEAKQAQRAVAAALEARHVVMHAQSFARAGDGDDAGDGEDGDGGGGDRYVTFASQLGEDGVRYNVPSLLKQERAAGRIAAEDPAVPVTYLGCVITGAEGAGASCLLDAFASQCAMRESIGTEFGTAYLFAGPTAEDGVAKLRLHAPPLHEVAEGDYFAAHRVSVVLYCFCDDASLEAALATLDSSPPPRGSAVALVRTKHDLHTSADDRLVQHAAQASRTREVPLVFTSAWTREGIDLLFPTAATLLENRGAAMRGKAAKAVADSTLRLVHQGVAKDFAPTPLSALNILECDSAQLRAMFDELDRDGSGAVDVDELHGLQQSTDLFGTDDFAATLRALRAEHRIDGGGKLSFDEFSLLLLRLTRR